MTRAPVVPKIDRVGLALVALLIGWVGFVGLLTARSPRGAISTLLLCTAAYALGRAGTRFVRIWLTPAAVTILAYAVYVESPHLSLSYLSSQGFLGYSNAKAAFFVQAAFATAMIVASVRAAVVAVLSLPAIALFASVSIHARSLGAFVSSLLLVPALLVGTIPHGRRMAIVVAAILAFGGIATSLVLSREFASDRRSDLRTEIADRISPGRAAVWADSYRLIREHPVRGVGPGGFADNSLMAAEVSDLRWSHNEFLQLGAEAGLVALALLIGLVGWLFWRLWEVGTARAAVAAFAVASLVIHACVEYLFHFPLLPAITAALAGAATGFRRSRGGPARPAA